MRVSWQLVGREPLARPVQIRPPAPFRPVFQAPLKGAVRSCRIPQFHGSFREKRCCAVSVPPWNAAGDAFLMYGVEGRSWIALGAPVGEPNAAALISGGLNGVVRR